MICEHCGPDRHYTAKEIELCWCAAELCREHMSGHVMTCAAYKNPSLDPNKPASVVKRVERMFGKSGFERIGGIVRKAVRR